MTSAGEQRAHVYAEQTRGEVEAAFEVCGKKYVGVRLGSQPCVARDFIFQLSCLPAGVTQGNEHMVWAAAVSDVAENF